MITRSSIAILMLGLALGPSTATGQNTNLTDIDISAGLRASDFILEIFNSERSVSDIGPVLVPSLRTAETMAALEGAIAPLGSVLLRVPRSFRYDAAGCQKRSYAMVFERAPGRMEFTLCPVDGSWLISAFSAFPLTSVVAVDMVVNNVAPELGVDFHPWIDCEEADLAEIGERFTCRAVSYNGAGVEVVFEKLGAAHIVLKEFRQTSPPLGEVSRETVAAAGDELFRQLAAGAVEAVYAGTSRVFRKENSAADLEAIWTRGLDGSSSLRKVELVETSTDSAGAYTGTFLLTFGRSAPRAVNAVFVGDAGALRLLEVQSALPDQPAVWARVARLQLDQRARDLWGDEASIQCPDLPEASVGGRTPKSLPCAGNAYGENFEVRVNFDDATRSWVVRSRHPVARVLSAIERSRSALGWPPGRVRCEPGPAVELDEYRCTAETPSTERTLQVISGEIFVILDIRMPEQDQPFVDLR